MHVQSIALIGALILSVARPAGARDCAVSGSLPEGSIFIGYSRTGESALRAAALLREGLLMKYDGKNLASGLAVHEALADRPGKTTIESVAPYLERNGPDHCEFPAQLKTPKSNQWRIWSTEPLKSLRHPTQADRAAFRSLRPGCVHQGDPPPGEESCVYPELLGISDVDADGHAEYWYSAPYRWDTGLTISEQSSSSGLEVVVAVCPGCAD